VGTLPEEDVPRPIDVDPSPVPARATQLAAIIEAANPAITKYFRIKNVYPQRLDASS
jgi:hypothetical protein